eukprot:438594-Prorocentrum_lima.AAC.1
MDNITPFVSHQVAKRSEEKAAPSSTLSRRGTPKVRTQPRSNAMTTVPACSSLRTRAAPNLSLIHI